MAALSSVLIVAACSSQVDDFSAMNTPSRPARSQETVVPSTRDTIPLPADTAISADQPDGYPNVAAPRPLAAQPLRSDEERDALTRELQDIASQRSQTAPATPHAFADDLRRRGRTHVDEATKLIEKSD